MLLSLAMLFTLVPTAFAAESRSETPATSGNCGVPNDENGEYTNTVTWSFNSTTSTLTISGNGAMANLNNSTETENISDGAGTYPWAHLKDRITNIVIADGVTSIGSKAFIAYTNVTSVSIGKDVSEIGVGALSQLSACTKFDVPSENSHFTTDATGALFDHSKTKLIAFPCGCSSVEEYEIPATVKVISYGAFSRAAHLKKITIPADSLLSTIGYGAFAFTTALETVNLIPASAKTIGDIPFAQSGVKHIYCADKDTKDRIQNKVNGLLVDVLLTDETPAIEFTDNGYTYRIDDDKALLVSAPKNVATPTVPNGVTCQGKTYPVTGIWKGAFAISLDWTEAHNNANKRNEAITSVVLPASVTQIGERAFYFCKNLSTIEIQANTVSIDKLAFATQNSNGTTVNFSAVTTLQSNSTDKWAGVKEVILNKENQLDAIKSNVNPNTVAVIGSNKWVMGSDGNWTEQPKKNLTATVDNITWTFDAVGGKATLTAYSSKEATSVTVPSTLTKDGVTYTVTELGAGLFGWTGDYTEHDKYNKNIRNVVIPKTVTTIGEDMFRYSQNLESVTIQGESITFKSGRTFSGTSSLKVLDMSAVKSIAFGANGDTYFSNMGSNKSPAIFYVSSSDIMSAVQNHRSTTSPCYLTYAVTNGGTLKNPPTSNIQLATPVKDGYIFDGWYADSSFSGTAVTAPTAGQTYYAKWSPDSGFCGAESNEKNITWKLTANKEDTSTYTLTISGTGDMANLVTLNGDLKVAQNNQPWASAAHQITKLVLNEGITSIGDGAFYDTPLLKSAKIPASVTKIGVRAFNWAETMDSLTFAKGSKLKEIGYAAFNKIAVSEVTIPARVEKIDKQAFGNDSKLTTVLFEQGSALKEIGENAFFKCGKLTKLILPEGLTTIGNRAFNNDNTSLAAVVIPSTVTRFGTEIYNTQNGCLYFANSEVYSRYTNLQTVQCFMGVMNDGTFAPGTVFTTGTLSKPTKTGFKFIGWYENKDCSGTAVNAPTAGHTYYAKWEEKAEKTAPAAPTLNDRTYTSITLNIIDGAQYRCNGGAWQTSPEFTGLTAGTTYTFEAYYPETANSKTSSASKAVEFSTLRHSSSSSSNPTYSVTTPSKSENGKVSLDKSTAKKGDTVTVTVTPDAGYQLDKLTVTDKNGNVLKLTDKGDGKYSFTMPDGKVEVKAVFAKEVKTSPFDDVSADAYYNKAVQWAQEKGITDGISSNLFGPKQPCTRSQIVTFLWRAAGSPEPKGTAAGMTDVVPGSYYAKAVAWAVENGITTGTAEGTFSPDATCTRAQAVTFLARAQNAKATGKTAFSDVPADSYFADAVAWAQANGVTTGTSETTFSPDNDCTRAQIVTFLYRANQGT